MKKQKSDKMFTLTVSIKKEGCPYKLTYYHFDDLNSLNVFISDIYIDQFINCYTLEFNKLKRTKRLANIFTHGAFIFEDNINKYLLPYLREKAGGDGIIRLKEGFDGFSTLTNNPYQYITLLLNIIGTLATKAQERN